MTEREAQELIRMAESNWHMDLATARGMWRTELMMWDAATATEALGLLARKHSYQLKLADLVETMEMLSRKAKDAARDEARRMAEERAITEGRRGYATPEWVWVWKWVRFDRAPRDMRSFPQQGDFGDPFDVMTMEEYETLCQEWQDAGQPKSKLPAMSL